ncbi:hypothetical protein M0Q97_03545 [Candidatus Dojkabacteria bacterium]|jgi:hypothetical protein|nr:hypothetical protein [Candidatus Dojkabacteria bacterium]
MAKKKTKQIIKDETSIMFEKMEEKTSKIKNNLFDDETKEIPFNEVKKIPTNKIVDKEIPTNKIVDKEIPTNKIVDKEIPTNKIVDKEIKEISIDTIIDNKNDVIPPEIRIIEKITINNKSKLYNQIIEILKRNHYYSYIVCGRYFNDYRNSLNKIPDNILKSFYSEFVQYGINSKDDFDLIETFKTYFNIK